MNGGHAGGHYVRLRVVELDVPVEVIAPAFWRVPQADRDADCRRGLRPLGHPRQTHAGFSRRSPAFSAVAADAAGDDVLPVLPAAMSDRQHMIEGELDRWEVLAAVLAAMIVARVNVGA